MPNTAEQAPARDDAIDCARGIAMILVVLGHNTAFAALSSQTVAFIFLFHVPAFFFISGYLLKPSRFDIWRSARRILTPFLVVGLLLALAKAMVRKDDVAIAVAGLFWATGATLPSSQLWFLPALFLTLLFAQFVARAWGRPVSIGMAAATLVGLALLAIPALHAPPPPVEYLRRPGVNGPLGWIWSIDLVPIAAFFCLAGYAMNGFDRLRTPPKWVLVPAALATLAMFLLGARTDLNLRLVEHYPLALAGGLLGSLAVLLLGRVAAGYPWLSGALDTIGRHSLIILAFHVLAQSAVVSQTVGSNPGRGSLVLGAVAGVVAGILGPLALSFLLERYVYPRKIFKGMKA